MRRTFVFHMHPNADRARTPYQRGTLLLRHGQESVGDFASRFGGQRFQERLASQLPARTGVAGGPPDDAQHLPDDSTADLGIRASLHLSQRRH